MKLKSLVLIIYIALMVSVLCSCNNKEYKGVQNIVTEVQTDEVDTVLNAQLADDRSELFLESDSQSDRNNVILGDDLDNGITVEDVILQDVDYETNQVGIYNVAILGTDERGSETSRSDVIMVIQYDENNHTATMISIPRDSRVYIPGYYMDKINHAYAFGGANLSVQTLENLFELKIDNYIKVSFVDFEMIIDKLGGVKVNSEKEISTSSVYIENGESTLTGEKALVYVRFRSDSEGDFGRIRRQQEVIESVGESLSSFGEKEIIEIISDIYYNNIITDYKLGEVTKFIDIVSDEYETEIENYTLKTSSTTIDGIWYEIINTDYLDEIKTKLN